ncbi:hypothetical protein H310_04412 [Aphanomyces invadans]|uniref:Uncharacterized protein n=1 Tax=Aphanomyces invadans TaxID=157072 RepID=A0A024UDQ1_9STRA|nr:hypothetical protein H310_04412 [Aphanomyces invadans]ETW04007.1 hypothetical protein H310_04412 [Aphanomyces invadans]|eukprot:XP_008866963.1 hypothetical protein H310_04412 [Aphanomyces invadans]
MPPLRQPGTAAMATVLEKVMRQLWDLDDARDNSCTVAPPVTPQEAQEFVDAIADMLRQSGADYDQCDWMSDVDEYLESEWYTLESI